MAASSAIYPVAQLNSTQSWHITSALTSAQWTITSATGESNERIFERLYQASRVAPQGPPLKLPPLAGTWIVEKTPGAQRRKIIDVVCGSHIVCEGKRHSIIKWPNLKRYIEMTD